MPDKHLHDGMDWSSQDGYIVGNIEGLNELREVLTKAIDSGEASAEIGDFLGKDGDFVGVRALDDNFFKESNRSTQESEFVSKLKLYGLYAVILIPFLVGVRTIINAWSS